MLIFRNKYFKQVPNFRMLTNLKMNTQFAEEIYNLLWSRKKVLINNRGINKLLINLFLLIE